MAEYKVTMPSESADEDLRRWFFLIDLGLKRREQEERRWDINEAFEDMRQWSGDDGILRYGEFDEPTINKIGSFIRTYRSAICYKNPRVKMTPKSAAGWAPVMVPVIGENGTPKLGSDGKPIAKPVIRVKAREKLINEIVGAPLFGLRDTISRVVKAGCLAYGAAITGYQPHFATLPEQDQDDDEIPIDPTSGEMDFSGYELNPLTGMPMTTESGKPIKKNKLPIYEEWFLDWVHYRNVIIDPYGGNDFMKHRWVAIEEVRPLDEVKDDPLFSNTSELKASGDMRSDSDRLRVGKTSEFGLDEDECLQLVRLYRIFDLVKNRMIVLADGHDKVLYDEVTPKGITHSPLGFFRPNERICEDQTFYPRPPVTDLVPLVSEKNMLRRMAYLAASRAVAKIITEKGTLSPSAQAAIANDVHLQVVEVEKIGVYGLDKSVSIMQPPALPNDVWNTMRATDLDFDEISGQSAASRGRASGGTATETQHTARFETARYDFDRDILADFLRLMFKKLNDSIDANMTIPRAIEMIGEDGQTFVGLIDRDMIAGDYDADLDVTEMAPTDDGADAARMIQFAQVIGQNPWMAQNETVIRTMAERVRIKDENFVTGLVEAAKADAQAKMMQMMAKTQPTMPAGAPPENEAQAIAQSAGGQQMPSMQGAA